MFATYFGIWVGVFLITFLVIKLPYRIADHVVFDRDSSAKEFIQSLILGKNDTDNKKTPSKLASS